MYTRFDLEQAIMEAWGTREDIKLVTDAKLNTAHVDSEDDLANTLIGIEYLHNLRMQRVFDIFEHLVKEGKIQ
jgi:hypothetical protein